MKISTVNYKHGGMAIEVIAETEVEGSVLHQIWNHGGFDTGSGNSIMKGNGRAGFYLKLDKKDSKDG